jgi:GTP-binding protein
MNPPKAPPASSGAAKASERGDKRDKRDKDAILRSSPYRVAEARFVAAGQKVGDLPPTALPEIAFAGKSNVGKSSLLNSLMMRRALVRTSKTPGATRTINLFEARLATGESLSLADVPGYGYANRAKSERSSWGPMLEGYLKARAELRVLVVLIDVRRGVTDDDRELAAFAEGLDRPLALLACATKIDKLPLAKRAPEVARLRRALGARVPVIGFSAVTHDGRDRLWGEILRCSAPVSPLASPSREGPE